MPSREAATDLLIAAKSGDKRAVDRLMPLVYEEMKVMARRKLRYERENHTLDTTALIHETYLKLINQNRVAWQSRAHFLAVAAMAMRRILVNYAEKKNAARRKGNKTDLEPDLLADNPASEQRYAGGEITEQFDFMSDRMADDILALNHSLKQLQSFNERGCRVIEYHFFGGLTWNEISEVMGIAPVTVRRSWYVAKLWLKKELGDRHIISYQGQKNSPGANYE